MTRAASGLSTGSSIQDRERKACRTWGARGSLQPLGDEKEPVTAFLSPGSQGPHIVPTAHPVPAPSAPKLGRAKRRGISWIHQSGGSGSPEQFCSEIHLPAQVPGPRGTRHVPFLASGEEERHPKDS